jgi:hypothetical protein
VNASTPLSYFRFDDADGATSLVNSLGQQNATPEALSPDDVVLAVAGAVAGQTGTALALSGGGAVTIPAGALPSGARSYEMWLRLEPSIAAQPLYERGGFGSVLTLRIDEQRRLRVGGETGNVTSSPLSAGVWHHIVVTISQPMGGGFTTLYVDGQEDGTGGILFFGLTGSGTIGSDGGSVAMSIDELAFYNDELTGSEVAAHYAAAGIGD